MTGPGNSVASCALAMPLTTADISIQLLMDTTVNLQEIVTWPLGIGPR